MKLRAREMPDHQKNSAHFLSGPLMAMKLLRSRGLTVPPDPGCIRGHSPGWVVAQVTERDGTAGVRYVETKTKRVQREAP